MQFASNTNHSRITHVSPHQCLSPSPLILLTFHPASWVNNRPESCVHLALQVEGKTKKQLKNRKKKVARKAKCQALDLSDSTKETYKLPQSATASSPTRYA